MENEYDYNASVLSILNKNDTETLTNIGKALSSPERLKILRALSKKTMNLLELSQYLKMPISSVSFNVDILSKAGLIIIDYRPSLKGHMKLCSLAKTNITLKLEAEGSNQLKDFKSEMPIGGYSEIDVKGGCLVDDHGYVYRPADTPESFFDPKRFDGQLLSFKTGYVTYNFPNLSKKIENCKVKIDFSLELCSEAPYFYRDWPSDITIYLNDVEITTYISPGDFGGKRGTFTPSFWKTNSTQYGLLKHFSIDSKGCYVDDTKVTNAITIKDLNLETCNDIKLKIAVKEDALHVGGINIFGKKFGNYNQGIIMIISEDINYDL